MTIQRLTKACDAVELSALSFGRYGLRLEGEAVTTRRGGGKDQADEPALIYSPPARVADANLIAPSARGK